MSFCKLNPRGMKHQWMMNVDGAEYIFYCIYCCTMKRYYVRFDERKKAFVPVYGKEQEWEDGK